MIDEYVGCIRRQQPHGPLCAGGLVVWRVSCGGRRTAPVRQRRAGSDGVNRSRVPTGFLLRKPAALLRLLAEGQTPLALPEHFDQQTPDSQLADFISLR